MKRSKIKSLLLFFPSLEYLFFRVLVFLINLMPVSVEERLAEGIGFLLFLRKRRRDFSIQNLRQAFPKKTQKEIEQIGRGSMQGMIKVIFEFLRIPLISKNPQKYIELQGAEHAWKALENQKGAIFAVSHFGNWELAGVALAAANFPIHAIGKPHKNPFVTAYIKRLRGLTGLKTINQKGAVQKCIHLLKKNQMIGMLIDEHAKKGAVWVDFFGQKAATSALPALLALKHETPIIPALSYRKANGKSVFIIGEPFKLKRTGNHEADVIANTQQYMHYFEKEIIKHPAEWTLWMHNRWRWQDLAQTA